MSRLPNFGMPIKLIRTRSLDREIHLKECGDIRHVCNSLKAAMGTKQAKMQRHPEFGEKGSVESDAEIKIVSPGQAFKKEARNEANWTLMKVELRGKQLKVSKPDFSLELQSAENIQAVRESFARQTICITGNSKDGEVTVLMRFERVHTFLLWSMKLRESKRPVWEDIDTPMCASCSLSFTFIRRQHHCRKCGRAVCGSCSPNQALLPDLGYYTPQRICVRCEYQLQRKSLGTTPRSKSSKSTIQVTDRKLRESIATVKSRDMTTRHSVGQV